ncbi:MAG: serine/threonine-protein kinase [Kofleriaceae bacterium]
MRASSRAATEIWQTPPSEQDRVTEVFGDYVVFEQLGAGGMATVHRAELRGIDGFRRPVALKRMLSSVAEDVSLVDAFVHEARLTSQLKHDNIAQAYDLGKHDGSYYIAMELVPGPTLLQVMAQCSAAAGSIPLPIAVNILIQICDALDYAHSLRDQNGRPLGIIHRDISPGNIIISNTGVAKLIDFGIAKATTARAQTQTGFIKGKFAYVAPEYVAGKLDARADLFGLGVVAHELLTNERLFRGKNDLETLRNLREMRVPRASRFNPDVPAELDDIVLTALQRDPAKRWQTAAAMRTALLQVAWKLGVAVGHQQVVDWLVWAFSQQPRRLGTELGALIDVGLEPSAEAPPPPPPIHPDDPAQMLRTRSLRNKALRNTSRNRVVRLPAGRSKRALSVPSRRSAPRSPSRPAAPRAAAQPPPIPPPRRRAVPPPPFAGKPPVSEGTVVTTKIPRDSARPWLLMMMFIGAVTAAWYV